MNTTEGPGNGAFCVSKSGLPIEAVTCGTSGQQGTRYRFDIEIENLGGAKWLCDQLANGSSRLLSYEAGGLALATPAYSFTFGDTVEDSALLVFAMSIVAMTWACAHNVVFDLVDLRLSGRVASDRPQGLRLVHALSSEFTALLVTFPVIMWLGGYGFWAAIAVDLGFTAFYAAYAYVFHIAYDRLRPLRPEVVV